MTLTVIEGSKKEKIDYYPIYKRMYENALREAIANITHEEEQAPSSDVIKIVFAGIRMINAMRPHHAGYEFLWWSFRLGSIN